MPYTPPSHRSPASSTPTSPDVSRRPSLGATPRPSLPRSASYLTKHRRTPSALGHGSGSTDQPTPPGTSTDLKSLASSHSVRQSPPPVTNDRGMPAGAVLSPPESASSSSDDEAPEIRGRQISNLKELHDAISQIPQRRGTSPSKNDSGTRDDLALVPTTNEAAVQVMHHSFSTGSLSRMASGSKPRLGHTRSTTEPRVAISKSAETSLTGSEDESDSDMQRKPQMVRKKSGELVRPALRLPSRRRPSSMPGTPTYSKSVHFDSHEHVRHFLQVDRPLAVSAGSSPADNYDSDTEYPFPGEQRPGGARSPPYEWEIVTANFPTDSPLRQALPVRLEKVWLSNDQKCLMGSIIVANLAFHKSVACRFTLDYWKTTSEVAAEYSSDTQIKDIPVGHDRFSFTVKLSDLTNLESKTLYCCIRYNVNGQEYWDNNNGTNFQVDFHKKHLPQNGKKNFQGAAGKPPSVALPRSNRRASPSAAPRPKSMPVGFDDFGDQAKFNFDQPLHEYLGEIPSALRLKSNKSTSSLPSDNLSSRLSAPSGQAFANRYDFGASLTAAVQAAKDTIGKDRDGLYMKSNKRSSAPTTKLAALRISASDLTGMGTDKAAPSRSEGMSPSAFTNASYEELVNKYCFFGSKQSSPQLKDGSLRGGRYYDGTDDGFLTRGTNSTNSSLEASPQMMHHAGPAEHHSLRPRDNNPYFQYVSPGHTSLRTSQLAESSGSSSNNQPGGPGIPATLRSSSPATIASDFGPFAGGSPSDYSFSQHMQQRFPFSAETPTPATASC